MKAQLASIDEAATLSQAEVKLVRGMIEGIEPLQLTDFGVANQIEAWQGLQASEIEKISRQLQESLDVVSRQVKLASFMPKYDEFVGMVSFAKPAWHELLVNPTASYAFAAMASLREAIDQGPFAETTIPFSQKRFSVLGAFRVYRFSAASCISRAKGGHFVGRQVVKMAISQRIRTPVLESR